MRCRALSQCCCAAARLQLLWVAPRDVTAACHQRLVHRHSFSSGQAYVSEPVQHVDQVPTPLCRRPGHHTEQLSALMNWRHSVLEAIEKIKDSFAAADGGPSASELQAWRELDSQQWQSCTWQQLDMERSAAARRQRNTQSWQVLLRAPVQHLQELWKLRLEDRVPFQYLIATGHWRDLVLAVGPGILVPRPETELMIDLAAEAMASNPQLVALPWADLGTGSGALAVSTARLLVQQQQPQRERELSSSKGQSAACVYAVDLSPTAVAYAAANAEAHGVQGVVQAVQGSWFEPLQQLRGKLGGVLSNPPYIPRMQIDAGLQAEVAQHEPLTALDGGPGPGMDSLQVICEQAVSMLAPGGYLLLETAGAEQAPLVCHLLQRLQVAATEDDGYQHQPAFYECAVHEDCYGVPRFVSATRSQL